ncbi:MAG: aminoglycoside phosphotransferase [Deltaproteobacteria bacterium]|nr:aminoglycoside phosphotransferase [Deltaproteobacteria bacterium]
MDHLITAALQFAAPETVESVQPYGQGNVNDTYLVTRQGDAHPPFILQRLNLRVFPRPDLIMSNLQTVTAHLEDRLPRLSPGHRFETPRPLPTRKGRDHWRDAHGAWWRALSFIDGARSYPTIRDESHAREVGRALGLFHVLLSDLPAGSLADTLPGFHLTPRYLAHYDRVAAAAAAPDSAEVRFCREFIRRRRALAHVLEDARQGGLLRDRVMHGDPKVDNVMVDAATGLAVGLVDLDTVKPGLLHYDVGDCLRSGCNPLGEETAAWEAVRFDADLCRAVLSGYLPWVRPVLTEHDLDLLYPAVRLIAFELGLRFFTDYLAGNVYFKVKHADHNLARALVQFRLTASIEDQEREIVALLREGA